MANSLTTGGSTDNASRYVTAEFQPTASALILVFVANVTRLDSVNTPAIPTLSGNGLTWDRIATFANTIKERRLTCFRALSPAPDLGAIVINFGGTNQDICAWSVVEFADVDSTGTNGANAVSQRFVNNNDDSVSMELPLTPTDSTGSRTIGALMLTSPDAQPVTPDSAYIPIHQQMLTQLGQKGLTLQTQDTPSAVNSIGWSWVDEDNSTAIVVEVKTSPSSPAGPASTNPTLATIRRFEPILVLEKTDPFVPVNARRFVESAALWAARSPYDDKNSWGTTPLVKAGQLSTDPADPTYLGSHLPADGRIRAFLELGGWKDRNQTHEATVTTTSTNVYADRAAIKRAYDGGLDNTKFFYHAELFDTTRLTKLADSVLVPNLSTTLKNFKKPVLLCYYFFYPGHVESVSGCPNVEGQEVACHAGDWQCYALLLEDEGAGTFDKYTPKYFGITGIRPAPTKTTAGDMYRPYAFDAEGRITMKVEAWRSGTPAAPVQPKVVDDHAQLYVALGSHSMYTTRGEHELSGFDDTQTSAGCGKFDTPSPVAPPHPTDDTGRYERNFDAILLAKLILGGLLGSLADGFLAGVIEQEASFLGWDTLVPRPAADKPKPESSPGIDGSMTVSPEGVTGTHTWPDEDHAKDLVVDRASQVWWPADDGLHGYRGRWGQFVASDPLAHRAGPKFPEFWKMFLTAMEAGFSDLSLARP